MSKEKRRVPKLRFPGFTEDWEQRKFGELFDYERPDAYIVKSDNYNDAFNMPVLTANKAFILGYTNEVNSYNKPSIIFDDFTLDRKYVDFPYMLKSSAIKILTSKNQHNLRFLFERLNSTRFEVLGHARHYISVVQNTTTLCPSIDEEVCISNLLTKFDELITLHQRKLDNLKLKKKALLQKLFPKNGERYPELRFPGFTDAWEQCKFSDITYLSGIKNKENKPYESYSISNEFGFIPQDEQFENGGTMKTADKSMYYIVSQNSFAYNPARINVGSIGYYDKPDNVIVSSLYEVFKTTDIVSDKFLWHWFKSNQFKRLIEKYQEGGVRLYFYYDKLCKGTIDLPTINEQNKISNLLDALDIYITLHQRKLDHLKLQKKALLQQMFV